MNVEMFYARTEKRENVIACVKQRLLSPADSPGMQPDWGLPSSYDVLLAHERKRKVALSQQIDGWMAGVESKEVLDFALLQQLSETLCTSVIAVQVSEVSGCCGFAIAERGNVSRSYFSDDDEDPSGTINRCLSEHSVPFGLISFKEAVQMRQSGWRIVSSAGDRQR